jgi:hypothetical protein
LAVVPPRHSLGGLGVDQAHRDRRVARPRPGGSRNLRHRRGGCPHGHRPLRGRLGDNAGAGRRAGAGGTPPLAAGRSRRGDRRHVDVPGGRLSLRADPAVVLRRGVHGGASSADLDLGTGGGPRGWSTPPARRPRSVGASLARGDRPRRRVGGRAVRGRAVGSGQPGVADPGAGRGGPAAGARGADAGRAGSARRGRPRAGGDQDASRRGAACPAEEAGPGGGRAPCDQLLERGGSGRAAHDPGRRPPTGGVARCDTGAGATRQPRVADEPCRTPGAGRDHR